MTENNKRVTVDFDSESYYLDGEYWESWDHYGEQMADSINKLLEELNNENERLKSELKIYRNVANCGNCGYHNYDWFDDYDEFEMCEKGNDMKYQICEDWEELE